MPKKKMTLHQKKALEFCISPALIAQAQRLGAVPTDINAFTKDDEDFLAKLARTLGVPKLLKAQLSGIPKEKRQFLVQTADYADLKPWEFHALSLFTNGYRKGQSISSDFVLQQLHLKYRVQNTPSIRSRLHQLRELGRLRARKEQSTENQN